MSKLSNVELYKYAQVKYDKYASPHMTRRAFQWMYSEARKEWLKAKYKDYEVVESVRADLRPFNRDQDFANTKKINLSAIGSNKVEFITAVWGDFEFQCNGKNTIYTSAIKPVSIDQAAELMRDPFNQPDDEFPIYLDRNDGQPYIEILSTTTPQVVTVHYIKKPEDYGLLTNPDGLTEEEETQQYEILDISVKKVELSIENFGKFQGMREEIQGNG